MGDETCRAPGRGTWTSQTHVMGSGTSRGKKVAPERVREVNGTEPGVAAKQGRGPFTRLLLSAVRNARPDRNSDLSEADTVLADDVDPGVGSDQKCPPKRAFIWSRTYGLCLIREEDAEEVVSSDPRVPRAAYVNKRNTHAFTHAKRHTPEGLTQHSVRTSICFMSFRNGFILFCKLQKLKNKLVLNKKLI